jgi:hypothetical protein
VLVGVKKTSRVGRLVSLSFPCDTGVHIELNDAIIPLCSHR